jgi:secondary thiamine-phosphate synthase enzyme
MCGGALSTVMETKVVELTTGRTAGVFDLTSEVSEFCRGRGDGLVNIFAPHATAGVAIIEMGAGSDRDLMSILDELLPPDHPWRHSHGSPGHGRDHVLPALVAPSMTVPVVDGSPALGTWQSIVLVDTNVDNPQRRVRLSFLG